MSSDRVVLAAVRDAAVRCTRSIAELRAGLAVAIAARMMLVREVPTQLPSWFWKALAAAALCSLMSVTVFAWRLSHRPRRVAVATYAASPPAAHPNSICPASPRELAGLAQWPFLTGPLEPGQMLACTPDGLLVVADARP